jgi:proline iminopeptidase
MRGPTRYPEIEPYEHGMLDVTDGQRIYWEACGNPVGKPAVVLHGGPGSGSSPGRRRWFDPSAYRIIQFDQRGCGRSLPSVSEPATDLSSNTTAHLIADVERLREHLEVDRWLVCGASWGVTLGLAYAERHPERVSELVFASVTMTRARDVHWLYHKAGRFFPQEWANFQAGVPERERHDDLVAAYNRLLNEQPNPDVRVKAAKDWCDWEDALLSLEEGWKPDPRYQDAAFRMTFARLCAHYFSHAAWLESDELLSNASRLAGG